MTEGKLPVRKRPKLVWVICVLLWLGTASGIYWNLSALSGGYSVPGPAGEFAQQVGPFDRVLSIGVGVLALVAAMWLFRLKRSAFALFVAVFFSGPALELYYYVTKPAYVGSFKTIGYWALITGLLLNGAVLLYVGRLRRSNVLEP